MDYIIVGAGPTGLVLAYYLTKKGKKVTVVDRQPSIGGCHRVIRSNGMFTEHAPRVYVSSYLNTIDWFDKMNICFEDHFTTYNYGTTTIMGEVMNRLNFSELFWMSTAYMNLVIDSNYGKRVSVKDFCISNGFSVSSQDYLDRLCRFSDGGGYERYSIFQLLQLFNQNFFYNIYQPKRPNDIALFPMIQEYLENMGVTFKLQTSVTNLLMNNGKTRITGITCQPANIGLLELQCNNLILAVPPVDIYRLVSVSPCPYAFGDINLWTTKSSYNVDIGATFHWDSAVYLVDTWGFPSSEWGLVYILLSEYMEFEDSRSQTVISVCITYLDRVSSVTGKTANETINPSDLLAEMFRQLKTTYPTLQTPSTMILSPTVYYQNNSWNQQDSAFFYAYNTKGLCSKGAIPNLFQVGPQNGNSPFHITAFETAVTSAMHFIQDQFPNDNISIKSPFELTTLLFIIFSILLILIIVWIILSIKDKNIEHLENSNGTDSNGSVSNSNGTDSNDSFSNSNDSFSNSNDSVSNCSVSNDSVSNVSVSNVSDSNGSVSNK